ncbi:11377_t:CDS:2 [Cetraspora pellucida]|uniref:11377_t:CDS:1 n=1 Tax=Cetraspora pellucida TaxID=1433469 RepID=A0ACA9KCU2_9GLOM|nr:11377_t:CDS:2 [Cetraspora pellucida]
MINLLWSFCFSSSGDYGGIFSCGFSASLLSVIMVLFSWSFCFSPFSDYNGMHIFQLLLWSFCFSPYDNYDDMYEIQN